MTTSGKLVLLSLLNFFLTGGVWFCSRVGQKVRRNNQCRFSLREKGKIDKTLFFVFHQVWFSCTIIHPSHSILGDGKKCGQRFGDWDRPRGSNILPILPIFDILDILDILDQPISDQQVEKALIGGLREKFPNTRWPHIKNHIIIQKIQCSFKALSWFQN